MLLIVKSKICKFHKGGSPYQLGYFIFGAIWYFLIKPRVITIIVLYTKIIVREEDIDSFRET